MMRALGTVRVANVGAVIAAGLLVGACARREPPSGGPPDIDPPRIVSTEPDSGSAGVEVARPFTITFSEPMEPGSTSQSVSIAPYVEIQRQNWKGRVLSVTFADSLQPNRTYTLFVGGTARDRHNNALIVGRTIVFSTADSFPRGRIEGRIDPRGFSGPGTHLWCYDAARAGTPDSTARDYDAIGFAGEHGEFRIDGLAAPGRYRLYGFADLNRNRSFEPETDVLASADTVIELTADRPVASGILLTMVNPRAPGRLRGQVVDSLPDSTGNYRVVARSVADSSLYALTALEANMVFDLQVMPGPWTLRAFIDMNGNRAWDPGVEPASDLLQVQVSAADEVRDLSLVIRRDRGP